MKREIGMKGLNYIKLKGMNPKSVKLLQVFRIDPRELSSAFKEYNYGYIQNGKIKSYKEQKQKLLILLLQDLKTRKIFTTSRKDHKENRTRFLGQAGKIFKIVRD